jgi:hypothetical protein
MHRVLRAIGAFTGDVIDEIAQKLYKEGVYESELYCLSLFCVGNRINRELQAKCPDVPQVTWDNIIEFIYNRFEKYQEQKTYASSMGFYRTSTLE